MKNPLCTRIALRLIASALLCFMGLVPASLRAQTYNWRNVTAGGGGFVTGIVFHPKVQGLVYARTDVGGAYRLNSTTNQWIPLLDFMDGLNNGFQYQGVLSIGLDPSDSNRVYLACGQYAGTESWKLNARFYTSADQGATWSYINLPFKMGGNGEGRGTGERLAIDPANGNNMLMGSSAAGMWRSTDRGVTWTQVASFGPTAFTFVSYLPNYSGTGSTPVYAAAYTLTTASLWKSTDGGLTWTAVPGQPGRIAGSEMMAIQGSFDASGVFYCSWGDQTGPANYPTRSEIWKLAADGVTWTKIQPPTGQGGFSGVSADARVAGHVIVSTLERWWPQDEIYRSTDGGTTWTAVLSTATRDAGTSPWSLGPTPHWITDVEIDPFDSNHAMFNAGFGLFSTGNLGASGTSRIWSFFCNGLEELVPGDLYSPTAGAPLISVTGDYTGFRHDILNHSPYRGNHNPANGSNRYIAGSQLAPLKMARQNGTDTYYSQDGGATWTGFSSSPVPIINGAGRIAISASGQRIIWCPPNSQAYYSSNNGSSWTLCNGGASTDPSSTMTVSTLAGSLTVSGSTDNSGGSARFSSPSGVSVGSTGIRYIADTGNHLIRKISAGASVSTLAGSAGVSGTSDGTGTAARFNSPKGIVVASGTIYVADSGNQTIRKISATGVVTTLSGLAGITGTSDGIGTAARFNAPTGLTADASANLYVADKGNNTIRKITPAGSVTTLAGSPGVSGAVSGTGSAALFKSPSGIAIDLSGNLYVADTGNHIIRKITSGNVVVTLAGAAGISGTANGTGTAARFNAPAGISVDAAGNVYVADTGNSSIRKISTAGVVTTLAGGSAGATDGSGTSAKFQNPAGIAIDPSGFMFYVADTGNHAIRSASYYRSLVPFADCVNDARLYLWDTVGKVLLSSTDTGSTFTVIASSVNSAFSSLVTTPTNTGHIWATAGGSGLYQSTNFGASFTKLSPVTEAYTVGFGAAAPGATYPAVFIYGKIGTVYGVFRSDNAGTTWTQVNDSQHQFGGITVVKGDSRIFGRVYLGTSGRGVVYGDLASTSSPAPLPSQAIYTDALQPGWTNASALGTNLSGSSVIRRGTAAIAVASGAGSAISLSCTSQSTNGYTAISFWLYAGGSVPPALQAGGARGGIRLESAPLTIAQTTGWQRIIVPLGSMGLANINDMTGLRIETTGATPGVFYVDDIYLVGSNDYTNIQTPATVTLGNLSATYDGTQKTASVTTSPAGLLTTVTYGGSSAAPVGSGTYLVTAVVVDPLWTGTGTGTLAIGKATGSVAISNLFAIADGNGKPVTITTNPAGLGVSVTYNGTTALPVYAGNYSVVATSTDANYQGSASATLFIRQPSLPPTGITGWSVGTAGRVVSGSSGSSPLLNPASSPQGASSLLEAFFSPITLVNTGDVITISGSVALSGPGTGGASQWFRYGLYDTHGLAQNIVNGWLGYTGMANSNTTAELMEKTGGAVDFATTNTAGGAWRTPNPLPTPSGVNSPSGTVSLAFTESITRTGTGVDVQFLLTNAATSEALMALAYSDTSPNNNGEYDGFQNTGANGYSPTYNAIGFLLPTGYISTTNSAQAQFSNIQVSFIPSVTGSTQLITFPSIADKSIFAAPFLVSATASSTLPVSFSVISGSATLSGSTVTVTGAGPVTLRASQSGNAYYMAAPPVDQSFNVIKAPATITLGSLSGTYDGSAKPTTVSTVPAGLVVNILYSGTAAPPTDAGSYEVVATISDPAYQGTASGTLTIAQASQSIAFPTVPDHFYGDAPFLLSATSTSGAPVNYTIINGPAVVTGGVVSLTGTGTVTISASQPGSVNYLPAAPVSKSFNVGKELAAVSLSNLIVTFDAQPKPVLVTTIPDGLSVSVTYNGSLTPPSATGSYSVVATVNDPVYQGVASGTLVIGPRTFSNDLTGWLVTSSTVSNASTSSPLFNPNAVAGGLTGNLYAPFQPVPLPNPGDSVKLSGSVIITPGGPMNIGQWFRFGLFDNRGQAGAVLTNWLGYCGMANGSASSSCYERLGGVGSFGATTSAIARTPQVIPLSSNSYSITGSMALAFTETIARTGTGVNVTFLLQRIDVTPNTTLMSYTYSDLTPNNNGVYSGASQDTPVAPGSDGR